MNRIDPLIALLRIALQALIECTRMRHFSHHNTLNTATAGDESEGDAVRRVGELQVQQMDVDLYALQHLLPQPLHAEQGGEEGRVVWAQMEEVRHSMIERCDDRLADAVQPLPASQLEAIARQATQLPTQPQTPQSKRNAP